MCLYPKTIADPRFHDGEYHEPIKVPCGKCLECLQQRSIEWAFRCMAEAKQYKENCFITLTYDEEHKPVDGCVSRRELQLFIKRLRKHLGQDKIRYFACGEYGKKRLRPHYHIIVFGWKPKDLFFWQKDVDVLLYRSPVVEKLWTFGFSSVGDVTSQSAKYCSKYLQKLQKLPAGLTPPFTAMSLRPGIGFGSISPKMLTSDSIYDKGKRLKVPRYYLKVLEREGHDLTDFKERRLLVSKLKERTPEQLKQARKKSLDFLRNKH